MSAQTGIEWCDATWNPVVGCSVVSPGCTNCYAMRMAARIEAMNEGTHARHAPTRGDIPGSVYDGLTQATKGGPVWTGKLAQARPDKLLEPLRRKKPTVYFVNSMGDLFHEGIPDEWIDRVFAVMALAPQHTFIVLTKRARRMRIYLSKPERALDWFLVADDDLALPDLWELPGLARDVKFLPNVVLGVSAERQLEADERVPDLLETPAAKRIVSAEPLLGPIDFERVGTLESIASAFPQVIEHARRDAAPRALSGAQIEAVGKPGQAIIFHQTPDHMGGFSIQFPRPFPSLDGVIVGGESGPGARPMHPDWARSIRDQCAAAGVPFFFKQWGEWAPRDACGHLWNAVDSGLRFDVCHSQSWEGDGRNDSHRVGKHRAGRLLDGREHNDLPWRL